MSPAVLSPPRGEMTGWTLEPIRVYAICLNLTLSRNLTRVVRACVCVRVRACFFGKLVYCALAFFINIKHISIYLRYRVVFYVMYKI